MPDSMTTRVVASTEVARMPPPPADDWAAIKLVFAGTAAVILVIAALISSADKIIAWRKAGDAEDRGEQGAFEQRIEDRFAAADRRMEAIADGNRQFRAGTEIDKDLGTIKRDILHNKDRQDEASRAAAEMIADDRRRLGALERQQSRFEAQLDGANSSLARIEQSVEKLGNRVDEKLDRLLATGPARG